MKENQLKIDSTGLWIRTREEKIDLWRMRLTDTLKIYGYKLLQSIPLSESFYLSFEKGDESMIVNCFKDGHIQISTSETTKLMESVIPHLEMKMSIKFDCDPDARDSYTPYLADYLTKRASVLDTTLPTTRKKSAESTEGDFRINRPSFNANVIKNSYIKIQDDLVKTRKRLNGTEDELAAIKTELSHLSDDLCNFRDKRKEAYQRYCFETYSPLYDYDFQRYLRKSKIEAARKLSIV